MLTRKLLDWLDGSCSRLPHAVYFFNTSTEATITLVNQFVGSIHDLTLSADEKTLYVIGHLGETHSAGIGSIYAFDLEGYFARGPRLVYQGNQALTGNIAVSSAGFLFAVTATGLDVIDLSTGLLLGKVNTHGDVIRSVAHLPENGTLYMGGREHIYRISLREEDCR
jgi:outer membrane protein assembly factor BamB